MKRREPIDHLSMQVCLLHREGKSHSVFFNPDSGHVSTIPRHREVDIHLARKICRQLGIKTPEAKA